MAAALSSSRRALHTLHRRLLLLHHPTPSPAAVRLSPPTPAPFPIPRHSPTPTPSSSRFFSTARPDSRLGHRLLRRPLPQRAQRLVGVVRSASTGGRSKLPPLGQGVKGLGRPVEAARSAVARYYLSAVGLQVEAFWRRNYRILVAAGCVIVYVALWRIGTDPITFTELSDEGTAKYGFLVALGAAIVAFTGMFTRPRSATNTAEVYRIAMTKLNTSAAVLEVMGAPLTGTDAGTFVTYLGGPRPNVKGFKFKLWCERCFFMFPIKGSERKGFVSGEVNMKKGQYDMKVLAVHIPMASGFDQRLFLIGDEQEYEVGGGFISLLRDPVLKDMAGEKVFDWYDERGRMNRGSLRSSQCSHSKEEIASEI